MAIHVSTFTVLADTRLTLANFDANSGALTTMIAVQGDGTMSTIVALERWDLSAPTSGDPVPPGAVILASDGGSNFTQISRYYTAIGTAATLNVARVLRDWVEGGSDGTEENPGELDPSDRGATWHSWSGAWDDVGGDYMPGALWTSPGASDAGTDIEGGKDSLTHESPSGTANQYKTLRETGYGGDMEMTGLVEFLQDSLDLYGGIVSVRTSRTAASTSTQWRTRENAGATPAILSVVWEDPPGGGGGGATRRRIGTHIGIGL